MPNYCSYHMRVTGNSRENVKKFMDILDADYNYNTGEFSQERHFFRVFDVIPVFEDYEDGIWEENGVFCAELRGDCAWSVYSCMCDGDFTYYSQMSSAPDFRGTTLQNESALLNLNIEVFSTEPGMCFAEHLLYKNGEEILNESVDYQEYYPDWYESFGEFCDASGYSGTEEDFEEEYPEGVYVVGGFSEEFTI